MTNKKKANSEINKQKHRIEDVLLDLLEETSRELFRRIKNGEASPQDISNAIRICKENDVDIRINEGNPIDFLEGMDDLPFEGDKVVSIDNG